MSNEHLFYPQVRIQQPKQVIPDTCHVDDFRDMCSDLEEMMAQFKERDRHIDVKMHDGEVVFTTLYRLILCMTQWPVRFYLGLPINKSELLERYPDEPVMDDESIDQGRLLNASYLSQCAHRLLNEYVYGFAIPYGEVVTIDGQEVYDYSHPRCKEAYETMLDYLVTMKFNLYNLCIVASNDCITSFDAFSAHEFLSHPTVRRLLNDKRQDPETLELITKRLKRALKTDHSLRATSFGLRLNANGINERSVKFTLLFRSNVTEINSMIYPVPIASSYMESVNDFRDSLKESRGGSKALNGQTKPLQDCEYFSRQVQNALMTISEFQHFDCGTKQRLSIFVTKDMFKDLQHMYYTDENGVDHPIRSTSTHLIGKRIKLRTVLNCKAGPQHVCHKCYGNLYHQLDKRLNPGLVTAQVTGEAIMQSTLGIKHTDFVSGVIDIAVGKARSDYLKRRSDDSMQLVLTDEFSPNVAKICFKLTDNSVVSEVEKNGDIAKSTNPVSLCQFEDFKVILREPIEDVNGVVKSVVKIDTEFGTKSASPTYELIELYNDLTCPREDSVGRSYSDKKGFVIEIAEGKCFPFKEVPIMVLPFSDDDMVKFQKKLETFLKSADTKKSGKQSVAASEAKSLCSYSHDPEKGVVALWELITSKIKKVNFTHIFMLVKSLSAIDPKNNDYRMASGLVDSVMIEETDDDGNVVLKNDSPIYKEAPKMVFIDIVTRHQHSSASVMLLGGDRDRENLTDYSMYRQPDQFTGADWLAKHGVTNAPMPSHPSDLLWHAEEFEE